MHSISSRQDEAAIIERVGVRSMAVTPMPPAVQIETRPRPEPRCSSSLASVATIRAPVAANGCPTARLLPFTLRRARSIGTERPVETEPVPTELRRLPGLQGAEHLGRERLVDLVELEILQGKPRVLEHAGHGIGRSHQ